MQQVDFTILSVRAQTIFDAASSEAEKIKWLDNGFMIAAGAILLLVTGLTVFISLKYRAKQGSAEPKQTSGNRTLEIWMVGIPLALTIGFSRGRRIR